MDYGKDVTKFLEKVENSYQHGKSVIIPDYYMDDLQEMVMFVKSAVSLQTLEVSEGPISDDD